MDAWLKINKSIFMHDYTINMFSSTEDNQILGRMQWKLLRKSGWNFFFCLWGCGRFLWGLDVLGLWSEMVELIFDIIFSFILLLLWFFLLLSRCLYFPYCYFYCSLSISFSLLLIFDLLMLFFMIIHLYFLSFYTFKFIIIKPMKIMPVLKGVAFQQEEGHWDFACLIDPNLNNLHLQINLIILLTISIISIVERNPLFLLPLFIIFCASLWY